MYDLVALDDKLLIFNFSQRPQHFTLITLDIATFPNNDRAHAIMRLSPPVEVAGLLMYHLHPISPIFRRANQSSSYRRIQGSHLTPT
jgi:hypothetical protein